MNKTPLHDSSGYTLAEVMVALFIVTLATGGVIAGIMQLNQYAMVNRLYTCANFLAQERIDRSLVDKPFDPGEGQVHDDLQLQTEVIPNVAVYKDPDDSKFIISGTMTTQVSSVSSYILTSSTKAISLQQTTVSVDYKYRGKAYNVKVSCLRSPDKAQ